MKRGRKGVADLTLVPLEPMRRPEPSDRLAPDEAALWREVVDSRPPAFFDAAVLPLLEQYCKHVVAARRLPADAPAFAQHTRASLAHARSLRITTQSRLSKAATEQLSPVIGPPAKKLWEM